MIFLHVILTIVSFSGLTLGIKEEWMDLESPLSDSFINSINFAQNSWIAGRNFPLKMKLESIKILMGSLDDSKSRAAILTIRHDSETIDNLPGNFDSRDKWPDCPSLKEIRDQGSCGSCWAIAAVEAMTDRVCIYSNATQHFHFSAQDLLSCCRGIFCIGCKGGTSSAAWVTWQSEGIVSGGNYNSSQGCRPYEIPVCEHHVPGNREPCGDNVDTPECLNTCQSGYVTPYKQDKKFAKQVFAISGGEDHIKAEIFKNGPVEATFKVYSDFIHYKSGVYRHTKGNYLGDHAVKIMGWGVEKENKYWLIANSWNDDWGDQGYFKFLRGESHCQIESNILAGEPLLTKNIQS